MTPKERNERIIRYVDGYEEVEKALEGFPEDGLTEHPIPGKWSAAEIVHHLADSEMTAAIRLRRLLSEDHPTIHGYDQEAFARHLHYNDRPIEVAMSAFLAARATTAQLLSRMTDTDWRREGTHTESGRYTAETWLEIYSKHAHDHAAQIQRLKEALAR